MRVIVAHNTYRGTGGELVVAESETALLRRFGDEVHTFARSNDEIGAEVSPVSVPFRAFWAPDSNRDLATLIEEVRPDVLHVHNTWLLLSPSIYWTAKRYDVAVVQTLHNYRLLCPMAQFLRDGEPCEKCLGKSFPYPGIVHKCYRDSRTQTALAGGVVAMHRAAGTWSSKVDRYIALTEFARAKFAEGGLPEKKLAVKPNFVDDIGRGEPNGKYALFVGRISEEKGLDVALDAWESENLSLPLRIAGDGPMAAEVRSRSENLENVDYLGRKPRNDVLKLMKDAAVLVLPSIWYEGLPMTIVEAFSTGLPVVASNLGAMSSLIDHGRTGLHFEPRNPSDLAAQIRKVTTRPEAVAQMSDNARQEYESRYTPEANHRMLRHIYDEAVWNESSS
jgi:glycosyltransferase involved in cell wall biosynthesis